MWHSSAWVCGRNAASLPVISSLETASPAIYFLWDGIGFRGGNAPPTTHIHTHLFKFLCFKLAQWAYTSLLIIFHLKHWEGVEAEHACSFIGAAVGCVRVCVWDGDDAAADSLTNECEATTQWTPAAVHFQGLMNLSDGKWGKAAWRGAASPHAHRSFERQNQPEAACHRRETVNPEMGNVKMHVHVTVGSSNHGVRVVSFHVLEMWISCLTFCSLII